jgi:hypothetical protein
MIADLRLLSKAFNDTSHSEPEGTESLLHATTNTSWRTMDDRARQQHSDEHAPANDQFKGSAGGATSVAATLASHQTLSVAAMQLHKP